MAGKLGSDGRILLERIVASGRIRRAAITGRRLRRISGNVRVEEQSAAHGKVALRMPLRAGDRIANMRRISTIRRPVAIDGFGGRVVFLESLGDLARAPPASSRIAIALDKKNQAKPGRRMS